MKLTKAQRRTLQEVARGEIAWTPHDGGRTPARGWNTATGATVTRLLRPLIDARLVALPGNLNHDRRVTLREAGEEELGLEAPLPAAPKAPDLAALRTAVADYMDSEGCDCCRNLAAHTRHARRLAELLQVPPHPEQPDWHDFSPYRTEETRNG